MHRFTQLFSNYCGKNLILTSNVNYNYKSLSICIIDCVYSLRAVYESMTPPVVNRYAANYMSGDMENSADTVSLLIQHIDDCGGPLAFTDKIIKNHQKIGSKHAVSKGEVCYQLARYLQALHIETLNDFRNFDCQELLEIVIHSVKGMGMPEQITCLCLPEILIDVSLMYISIIASEMPADKILIMKNANSCLPIQLAN